MDMKRSICLRIGILLLLAGTAEALTYLGPMVNFVTDLIEIFMTFGYSLAVVMFLYGAAKYVYTSDDPGGRKQALSIMVAAVLAIVIIQVAKIIVCSVAVTNPDGSPNTDGCI